LKYLRWMMYNEKIDKDEYKRAILRIKEMPWIKQTDWEPDEDFPGDLYYEPASSPMWFAHFKSVKEWKQHLRWLFFRRRISADTYAYHLKNTLKNAKKYIKSENAS